MPRRDLPGQRAIFLTLRSSGLLLASSACPARPIEGADGVARFDPDHPPFRDNHFTELVPCPSKSGLSGHTAPLRHDLHWLAGRKQTFGLRYSNQANLIPALSFETPHSATEPRLALNTSSHRGVVNIKSYVDISRLHPLVCSKIEHRTATWKRTSQSVRSSLPPSSRP
jgi:hypothetical protein